MCGTQDSVDDFESLPASAPHHIHLLAGAFSGIAEHALIFPVDAIKTRLQYSGLHASSPSCCSHAQLHPGLSRTGWIGLWRGIGSVVVAAGPSHALYFSSYEYTKNSLMNWILNGKKNEGKEHAVNAVAGGCATVVHDAFVTPFDGTPFLFSFIHFLIVFCSGKTTYASIRSWTIP